MSRSSPLDEIQPSQLYISSEKLARVVEWLDFDEPDYEPLPAFEYNRNWYLSDGHTRAVAIALAGENELRIRRDHRVGEEFDRDVYLTCIDWCDDEGVESVFDLIGRVVEPDTFEEKWVNRCQSIDS